MISGGNNPFPGDEGLGYYLGNNDDKNDISDNFGKFTNEQGEVLGLKEFIRPPAGKKFLRNAAIVSLLAIFALFGRIAALQIVEGENYRMLAEGNRLRVANVSAERGVIADRNGKLLVQNVPTFSLSVVPQDLPKDPVERENTIKTLALIAEVPLEELKILLEDYSGSNLTVPVKENLNYESALLAEIKSGALSGVSISRGTRRFYTSELDDVLSLSHILGYTGKISKEEYAEKRKEKYLPTDRLGKTGVELIYESFLRGISGVENTEVDALGHKKRIVSKEDPVPGKNVILAIDYGAQKVLEESLRKELASIGAKKAVAIALDPRDGSIIALVNLPSYPANAFSFGIKSDEYKALLEDPNIPMFPRAISGEYPSGSVIKPFFAAAALDEGIITQNTVVHSTGGISVGKWFFPDWKAGGHGDVNVINAIAQSVNTFFYYIGGGYQGFKGLGDRKMAEHAQKFGFGSLLGIDLDGEKPGLLPTEEWRKKTKGEEWYIGDTYHMAIGQGDVLVTPLQIAVGTGAIANGGTVWQPHVIYGYAEPDGTGKKVEPRALMQEAAKKESLAIVRRGMRETVLSGSARYLSSLSVPVAGKTGTAQWREGKNTHAWFTGFAPYENPEIVITVLIEEGGEGSSTAVPVARDFLKWYFEKNKK